MKNTCYNVAETSGIVFKIIGNEQTSAVNTLRCSTFLRRGFALESLVKEIPLGHGKFAIVDDDDFERLSKFKWHMGGTYAMRKRWVQGKTVSILMHRDVLPPRPGMRTHHINENRLDNRRSNLTHCTPSEHVYIHMPQGKNPTSRFRGVTLIRKTKRWVAQIYCKRERFHLGCFGGEEEAARAYDKKARELFGEFARCNFLREM